MKIAITSARAPVALEWTKFFRKEGHAVILLDSLSQPLAAHLSKTDEGVTYRKLPAPRWHFPAYQEEMRRVIDQVDFLVPTCEDIFFLAQLDLSAAQKRKCFMTDARILLNLHHKQKVYEQVCVDSNIKFPKTKLLTSHKDIDWLSLKETILKPVYSRFGSSVILNPQVKDLAQLEISSHYPWVQEQRLQGVQVCHFAICQSGQVITQVAYKSAYELNGSASSFFEPYDEPAIFQFVQRFVSENQFTGQLAFDFMATDHGLYLLECNPRATSGLHLVTTSLHFQNGRFSASDKLEKNAYSIGGLLFPVFAWASLKKGKIMQLIKDIHRSESILKGIKKRDLLQSLYEFYQIARQQGIGISQASTYDFEYNGEDLGDIR